MSISSNFIRPYFRHLILVGLIFSGQLLAQQKFEKEVSVQSTEVPARALNFIAALPFEQNVKWYKEIGLDKVSFEAKFRYERTRYSIEFDTLGYVEDVEIEVSTDDINSGTLKAISAQLESDCNRYRISKVQRQYSGQPIDLLSYLNTGEGQSTLIIRYELVVACRENRKLTPYEYLFSEDGQLISVAEIIFKNSSHLEY